MEKLTLFAERMKEARERKGIKQKELSALVNVTPQTISAYEKAETGGKGKNPTLENAASIAKELGVSLDWLCGLDAQRTAEQKFRTCGDVARTIVSLSEAVRVHFDTVSKPRKNFGDPYDESMEDDWTQFPAMAFESEELRGFMTEWGKIRDLWKGNVIDEKLYRLWLKDRFEAIDGLDPNGDFPLGFLDGISEKMEDDETLPFD